MFCVWYILSYLKEEIKKKDEEITKLLEVQRKYTIELHKKNEEIKRSSQKKDNELHEKLQEIKQLNRFNNCALMYI